MPVFAMPRSPAEWGGAAGLWVTVGGWAAASRRAGLPPVVVTPSGLMDETDCLEATARPTPSAAASRSRIPLAARQFVKDARLLTLARRRDASADALVAVTDAPSFVWQHHELAHRAGVRIADRYDVPLIEYVHAPIVWEARRWGVTRPLYGGLLERVAELPQLRRADLVACVSAEVAEEVARLGVAEERLLVSPMAIDPERFDPAVDSTVWRERFERLGSFVVGWMGSFRRFHALDSAFHAMKHLAGQGLDIGLVLIGDGQDRGRLEALASELGIADRVMFVGQVGTLEMPAALGALDAALLTAEKGQSFHYSPHKLREYMAMELPVAAPAIGEIARFLDDEQTALMYEAGDTRGLADAIRRLADDVVLRRSLGARGRAKVLEVATWDVVLGGALARIGLSR